MTATEDVPTIDVAHKRRRMIIVAIGFVSLLGAATSFYFYKRHADVWLRRPPRLPSCTNIVRRQITREETVSGSIPHMAPDGHLVYLRPGEDRAVRCIQRLSATTAAHFAAAFAEVDPDKRARALGAIMRDHVSPQPSADAEAAAAWLIASAAFRPMPQTQEINDLRRELDQRNACRFALHSPCPTRPPIPLPVWIFGVPSSVGLVVSLGSGAKALTTRLWAWWQKRRQAKKDAKPKTKKSKNVEKEEQPPVNP